MEQFISSADHVKKIGIRLSPFFPGSVNADKWAEKHGKRKVTLDWGSYCYFVNKQEIIDCITWLYRNSAMFNDPNQMLFWEGKHFLVDRLDELVRFCAELPEEGSYAIVRSEL